MRALSATCAVVACLACAANPTEPETKLILETTQASYVAVDDPDPRYDFSIPVIVKFRNETGSVVRLNFCTATSTEPTYVVEAMTSGGAAWNPNTTCALQVPHVDLARGGERTDTLLLRAPWQRAFNGQPIGVLEGEFRIAFEVQMCGSVTQFGQCLVSPPQYDWARSNRFTISTP